MLVAAAVVTAAPFQARAASSGGDLSLDLRQNVVRVTATWKNGSIYDGFGFVVGDRAGTLYVVTADHVVRGDGPDAIDQSPKVAFFADKGAEYSAELLQTRLAPGEGDVAILRLAAPAGLAWRRPAVGRWRFQRGASVWFVGLLRDWFVPSQPGSVNRVEPNGSIVVEGLNVKVGTSGAPLISEGGIVGMVVADAGIFARATPIDLIERAVKEWGYPWDLTLAVPPPSAPDPVPPPRSEPAPPPSRPPPAPPILSPPIPSPPAPSPTTGRPPVHDCDRLAAPPNDPFTMPEVPGVTHIDVRRAFPACQEAVRKYPAVPRFAYQLGRVYEADDNVRGAAVWYRPAANAGYAPAQVDLGRIYENTTNPGEALRLFRLAANQGYARGQNSLGRMSEKRGDDREAVRLYRLAAQQGLARAQMNLGRMYEGGRGGLARDTAEALRLYELAAAQGYEPARRAVEGLQHFERQRQRGRR